MYVGVDGCPGGWISVTLKRKSFGVHLYATMKQLVERENSAKLILVDIPIGLVSKPRRIRECDHLARKLLAPRRHASVFSPPARKTLQAKSYREACRLNKAETGVQLSLQSYNLSKKIKEVDKLLLANRSLSNTVLEAHPEVAFTALNGRPLHYHKRTAEGAEERSRILQQYVSDLPAIISRCRNLYKKTQVRNDDLYDALVLAVMAREAKGKLSSMPAIAEVDTKGLPMQIVYFDKQLKFTMQA